MIRSTMCLWHLLSTSTPYIQRRWASRLCWKVRYPLALNSMSWCEYLMLQSRPCSTCCWSWSCPPTMRSAVSSSCKWTRRRSYGRASRRRVLVTMGVLSREFNRCSPNLMHSPFTGHHNPNITRDGHTARRWRLHSRWIRLSVSARPTSARPVANCSIYCMR
jgi:hypothetical protein